MARLRRSDVSAPGYRRRRHGRGFSYQDTTGTPLPPGVDQDRAKSLVIPPAWQEVWICPDPLGHIQASGIDDAGRRQYIYHPDWRTQRDKAKHKRVLRLAEMLPTARKQVATEISGDGVTPERVMAAAFRLLDVGFFRIGSEQYAARHGTFGLATLLRSDVTVKGDTVRFAFIGKHSMPVERRIIDSELAAVVNSLKRRRDSNPELLAWRSGRRWVDVQSQDINEYIRELTGSDFTAKDFRTWHGTVLAAIALAVAREGTRTEKQRQAAIRHAVKEVARYLGNTPTVARSSYINPRVLALFDRGRTIPLAVLDASPDAVIMTHGPAEAATLTLLQGRQRSRR